MPLARVTGTLLLTAFLLLALAFAVLGAFQTRGSMARTFALQSEIQAGQTELEELSRLQVDEENSLRGYALTHDPFYVDQYTAAAGEFDLRENHLRRTVLSQGLTATERPVDEYASLQRQWRDAVAKQVLANPSRQLAAIEIGRATGSERV